MDSETLEVLPILVMGFRGVGRTSLLVRAAVDDFFVLQPSLADEATPPFLLGDRRVQLLAPAVEKETILLSYDMAVVSNPFVELC